MTEGCIVGAGAQGRIIAELWRAQDPSIHLGFVDDNSALQGQSILDIPVRGPVDTLRLQHPEVRVVLAIGDNPRRLQLAALWEPTITAWATLVHPSATVMPSAQIGGGSMVFAGGIVNTGARLGRHVVINTGAIVEHDVVIEDGASLSPGVCMGGRVHIERGAFISVGVTIAPRLRIGAGSVIGAGAVVVEDVPPGVLAYGAPARVIRRLAEQDFRRLL